MIMMMMMMIRTQNFLFSVFLTCTDLCTHRVDFQPIVESCSYSYYTTSYIIPVGM